MADPGRLPVLWDHHARRVRYLRVSLTNRCPYRCVYCMPGAGVKVAREVLPTLEEITAIVGLLADRGIERVRLTGGEPLLRSGVPGLIADLLELRGIREVVMTTNGMLLEAKAQALQSAGLGGLSVSLDSLRGDRFAAITRGGALRRVLRGIDAALEAGLPVQTNTVVIRGCNDDELTEIAVWCWSRGVTPRFVELMPIGALGFATPERLLPAAEVLAQISRLFRLIPEVPDSERTLGPADYWSVEGGRFHGCRVGLIRPISKEGFCASCNRVRLTARGGLRACLADDRELPLLAALRSGSPRSALLTLIGEALAGKRARHRLGEGVSLPVSPMAGIGG